MKICALSQKDYPKVCRLLENCYRDLAVRDNYTEKEINGILEICTDDIVRKRYSHYDSYTYIEKERPVAVMGIEDSEIAELFVDTIYQNRGIGSKMLSFAEDLIGQKGSDVITVHTASAPEFYKKHGYTLVCEKDCEKGPLKGRPLWYFEKRL